MRESQKRANKKWLAANYEKITIQVPKGTKEEVKAAAAACGMSMAAFIKAACKEKAERLELSPDGNPAFLQKSVDNIYCKQYNIDRERETREVTKKGSYQNEAYRHVYRKRNSRHHN